LTDLAHEAVAAAVRTAYGRLIAYLSARTRDIAAAEDALSAALEAALETWPARGVPNRPEAWLLTAARNRLKDGHRRALCDAIYATYGLGWGDYAGEDEGGALSGEAITLGFALYELLGQMKRPAVAPELNGLLALMLYCEARRAARYDASGRYVALSDQDPRQWDRTMIERGDALLTMAQPLRQFGRYQLEAAIQSAHFRRGLTGVAALDEIVILYEGLLRLAPSLAARVGHAAAVAEAKSAEAGLALLDALDGERLKDYQPYWAVRAHVLQKLGRPEAHAAFDRAIGLSRHDGQRAFLLKKQTAAMEQNRDG
jgi:RNA polymerase sigma-70 factor (ECF subfamily)